jgi:MFS family permease
MVLVGLALLLLARTPVDGSYLADLLAPMLLIGVGIGISFSSLMTLAMSGATQSDAGLASGIVNTSAQVGGAIGLAVLATLAAERTGTLEDGGASVNAALNSGFHLAYLVAAGLVAAALAIAIFVLRSEPMPDPAAMAAAGEEPQGATEPAYSEAG